MKRKAFTLIELLVVIAIIAILAAILFPVFAKARERGLAAACISNTNQIGKALMMYTDDNNDAYPQNRFYKAGSFVAPYTWKRAMMPYCSSIDIWKCPANKATMAAGSIKYQTVKIGDESNANAPYKADKSKWLPSSYGYNAALFYKASAPAGWFQDAEGYTVKTSSIKNPSEMMVILETRTANPDLGTWMYKYSTDDYGTYGFLKTGGPRSVFFTHGGKMNLTFADGSTRSFSPLQVYQKNLWGLPSSAPEYSSQLIPAQDIKNWPIKGTSGGTIDPADVQ